MNVCQDLLFHCILPAEKEAVEALEDGEVMSKIIQYLACLTTLISEGLV